MAYLQLDANAEVLVEELSMHQLAHELKERTDRLVQLDTLAESLVLQVADRDVTIDEQEQLIDEQRQLLSLSAEEMGGEAESYCWGSFETEEKLARRMERALTALEKRYVGDAGSILCCSHGGPCAHAHKQLVGTSSPQAGYTALYVFARGEDGAWEAPIAADNSHLPD